MSMNIDFLSPRLVGKRFEGHAIPLEVLKDFAVLEDLAIETAKWLYLKDHPGRERIPKGFIDGISIKMTGISEGSAVPAFILEFSDANTSLFPYLTGNQQYFEKARNCIVDAINAAEFDQDNKITDYLPDSSLNYFDRLGRSLQEDESIEFRPENRERPARLNKTTRKKLILASDQVKEYTDEVTIKGYIPEVDQDKNSFTILLNDNSRITVGLDNIHRNIVFTAFNKFKEQQKVSIKGIGCFNRNGKLTRIESIEDMNLIDKLDISERLSELSQLEPGWLDGKGVALDNNALKWLDDAFNQYDNSSLPLPCLYPTAEGGVQAEWTINDWEISLGIDLGRKQGDYQAVNINTGEEDNASLDLSSAASWENLNSFIQKIQGVTA